MPALPSRRRVKIWARAIEPDCYEGSILNSLIICLDNGVHFKEQAPSLHGWVYCLSDGIINNLLTINPGEPIPPIYQYEKD